jgi:Aerotolerance regulator N-terminal
VSFLAPGWLLAGAIGALLVVVLHFFARRNPRPFALPTTRFIPDRPASAAALARLPSDLLLLFLRAAALLLLGVAFAQPVLPPPRHTAVIALVDHSRAASPLDDSTAALIARADRVVEFDSAISSGLIAAYRVAGDLRRDADSVDLLVVSPFVREEWDAATLPIARTWPGRIRIHPIAARTRADSVSRLSLDPDDPLAATLALLGPLPSMVRVVRQGATAADSAWARGGGALVVWPENMERSGWTRSKPDTASAVATRDIAVVAPFLRTVSLPSGNIIARWNDGSPAAVERPLGNGCERDIAIPVTPLGDFVLRPSVRHLTRRLLSHCGGDQDWNQVSDALIDSLSGPAMLASTAGLGQRQEKKVPAQGILLIAALVLLLLETVLRRRRIAP